MNLDDCLNKADFRSLFVPGAASAAPARTSLLGATVHASVFPPVSWEDGSILNALRTMSLSTLSLGKSKLISKCSMFRTEQETTEKGSTSCQGK